MHPDSGPFHAAPRHFFLKYVSIPAKKCLAQCENSSLPVTLRVFRYTLGKGEQTMFKQHKFWAAVMAISALMCLITGMVMTHPGKPEEKS